MPKRVYLQPKELVSKSRHHTSYAGDGAQTDGKPGVLYKLEFEHGVAKGVDEQMYARFKDLGHCSTSKPKMPGDDEE